MMTKAESVISREELLETLWDDISTNLGLIKRCDQLKFYDYLLDRIGFILLYLIGICVALLAVWLDVAAASVSISVVG